MAEYKDRIRVHIEGKEFNVVGGSFQEMLTAVKQINGRRFVSELKVWQLPGAVDEVQRQLEISGYMLEGGAAVEATGGSSPAAPARGDRIRIMVGGQQVAVVGGSFQDMLAAVKNLPGRRFDGDAKIWQIPGDLAVIKGMIQSAGFNLEGAENVGQTTVPPMETPSFGEAGAGTDLPGDDRFPFEPPDWDNMPPPPDEWAEETNYFEGEEPAPRKSSSLQTKPLVPKPGPAAKAAGDRVRVRVGGIPMAVTGGSFQNMLAAIKNIEGRRFDSSDKVWDVPEDIGLAGFTQAMNAAGFDVERD